MYRRCERIYCLRVHGKALLNSMLNSTISVHSLDVTKVNLTMATTWSDEAEKTYFAMEAAIK